MGTFYASNDYRNYIAHYGVKGMKWGVRKQRDSGRRSIRSAYHGWRASMWNRAAKANHRDAEELRQYGFKAEAKGVEGVARDSRRRARAHEAKAAELQKRLREKQATRRSISDRIADHKYARYTRKADKHAKAATELALQGRRTGNAYLTDAAQASREASAYYRKKALKYRRN